MSDALRSSVRPTRSHKYAGKSVRRGEDPDLLRGKGGFLADNAAAEALEVFIVRSPLPHAIIRGIKKEKALAQPGVIAVFTADDLELAENALPCLDMIPGTLDVRNKAMATDRVRYMGQPVAALVATSRYLAEDAAPFLEIDYEPVPSIMEHMAAAEAGAPLLYPEYGTNVVYTTVQRDGDTNFAARETDVVIRKRFAFHRQTAVPMETRGVVARLIEADGRLHVESTTQIPHTLHAALVAAFGLDASLIRVTAPRLGGGFGCKEMVYPEEIIVPAVTRKLGRAARWFEDRREYFGSSVHGREETVDAEAVVAPDGVFVGLRLTGWGNIGAAFGLVPNSPITAMAAMARGPYRVPNLEARVFSVVTNKAPFNVLRGAGAPQAALLMERLMDEAAKVLKIDRAEIRRRNLIQPSELPLDRGETDFAGAGRIIYDEGDYPACLEAALKLADYEHFEEEREQAAKAGKLRGIGIGMYVEITAVGPYENARIQLQRDGTVVLFSSIMPMGQGSETVQRQLAAEELGIPIEQVSVRQGDTDEVPDAIGTFASRGTAVGGAVARLASRELLKQIRKRFAEALGCCCEKLTWESGYLSGVPLAGEVVPMSEIPARIATLAKKSTTEAIEGTFRLDVAHPSYAYAAHVAVVEIDPQTGHIEIPRYVVAHDCGKVANPLLVEGQIVGGVVQGIGQVLREKLVYDSSGNLQTRALMDYVLPGAGDLPPDFRITHMETPTRFNPFGMRGAGEGGCTGSHAALGTAVADALRDYPLELEGSGPFSPSWVVEMLNKHSTTATRSSSQ